MRVLKLKDQYKILKKWRKLLIYVLQIQIVGVDLHLPILWRVTGLVVLRNFLSLIIDEVVQSR